jgi:hypothetical protein
MSRVTLLHGFLGSPSDWAEVLALLPTGITCDCVPLRELGCRSIADAADALGVALCHGHTRQSLSAIAASGARGARSGRWL